MQAHWKVLLWMAAGIVVGLIMQWKLDAPAWSGSKWKATSGVGIELVAVDGPSVQSKLSVGSVYDRLIVDRGRKTERTIALGEPADFTQAQSQAVNGQVLWLVRAEDLEVREPEALTLGMAPDSPRAKGIYWFAFAADIFMALLKMLIVPLVMSSIVSGVASVGALKDLRRLGLKTFSYYLGTSLLAVLLGQLLVNLIKPGVGAELGLSANANVGERSENFMEILKRMVPENVPTAMTSNGAMLQIIFFALLLGYFITRAAEPHSSRVRDFFESFFQVMMRMAEGVLALLPYGVFALLVKVVAGTGVEPFKALLLYMGTVALALVLHAGVTLPLVLKFVGKVSPIAWFRAMSPALMTAFSTSSSSMTLPVTLQTVEERGKVSNKVTSFTRPRGATIFLAQYYATLGGEPLSFSSQALVVMMALMASVGAAGIPSAGLVMMLTILSALNLPLEGAALLLAVDRPLDMMRTVVNVWSDSCGAAIVGQSEHEMGVLEGG